MSEFHQTSERIDLGIAICVVKHRGEQLTCEQIAAYCDCSPNTVLRIERVALAKVRRLLRRAGIGDLAEVLRG